MQKSPRLVFLNVETWQSKRSQFLWGSVLRKRLWREQFWRTWENQTEGVSTEYIAMHTRLQAYDKFTPAPVTDRDLKEIFSGL